MGSSEARYVHRRLDCGIDFAAELLPGRHIAAMEIRVLSGMAVEPAERLGLAFQVEQTISKGTAKRTGPQLSDAFDAIGALHGSWVGRETIGFKLTCLPDFLDPAIDLMVETIRTPTFPEESCRVGIELANQELTALEDDPGELSRKLMLKHAYGPLLGRHAYGDRETLERIKRDDVIGFWRTNFAARRMQVVAGGPIDAGRLADKLERSFAGFGDKAAAVPTPDVAFSAGRWHYHKELEQQHISIC